MQDDTATVTAATVASIIFCSFTAFLFALASCLNLQLYDDDDDDDEEEEDDDDDDDEEEEE